MMKRLLSAVLVCVLISINADARNARGGLYPFLPSVVGLHVVGNHILNSANQIVPLRGVDQDGTEYMCLDGTVGHIFDPNEGSVDPTVAPSSATVAAIQSWAIDIVRLPVNESCWLGINGATTGGTTYQNAIAAYVATLTAANIAVIIDLQWVGPGTQLANLWCGGQFAPLPDNDHAPAFWTSVANTFKANSSVIFDLYNEPLPNNNAADTTAWTLLASGGSVTTSNSSCPTGYTAVGTQSLVNTIRATGATNIIDVPGVQFTNTLGSWLAYEPTDTLSPPQLAAAWHSYSDQICNSSTCWNSVILPVLNSVPVITEEIGERDCQSIYIIPLAQWLDANGGNYLEWAWDTYTCTGFPSAVTNAMTGAPTYTFGSDFQIHLLGLVGRPAPSQPNLPKFSNTYPFGLAIGASSQHTATDGTIFYPDIETTGLDVQVTNNPPYYSFSFSPFTTGDTITGTSDPILYQTGRQGCCAAWVINVPNGSYYVTLGVAPNSTYGTGQYGQDQLIQSTEVNGCVWSNTPGSGGGCGVVQSNPTIDVATTITYPVNVYNQQLLIEVAASEGGGRTTILNTIKVCTSSPC